MKQDLKDRSGANVRRISGKTMERKQKNRPRRVLIAYSMTSTFTSTTLDYLLALKNFSDYEVKFIHVTHDARMNFDINDFDVVINSYCARFPFEGYVSSDYEAALHQFRGLKIIAVQDDYDRTATLHRAIRRLGFHVLLTCIQADFWPLAYPKSELPGLKIIQGLTGYMPERLIASPPPIVPLVERQTWIGYRGRAIGAKYGRLGFDKEEIGRRMLEICNARNIPHDIAMDDNSRIYGDAWFEFLGSSRTMLGSESGSNAFDFDGRLESLIAAFTAENGRVPTYPEFRNVVEPFERPFDIGQISPRVFECAIMRTPMILFRGRYSNAIEPDAHYIPLERDFSNVDSVLAKLEDLEFLNGVSERAYDRLVTSGLFGYNSLAKLLIEVIEEQYPIRIDPKWIAYRTSTSAPRQQPTEPETEEHIRQMTLAEVPTQKPLLPTDHREREKALVHGYEQMLERRATRQATEMAAAEAERMAVLEAERLAALAVMEAERERQAEAERAAAQEAEQAVFRKQRNLAYRTSRSLLSQAVRAGWHCLPLSLRQKVVATLKKLLF